MKNEAIKEYMYKVIIGKEKGIFAVILRFFLIFPSLAYAAGVTLLAWLYQSGRLQTYQSSKRVISIGNITLGGTGKTPLAIFIAKYLLKCKWQPAIVTRGYMPEPGQKSDEVMMLEEALPTVPILAGPDKIEALQTQYANVFLLDDGFQHWRIKRNMDIVVIDVENPFGNGWVIPRGILRERLFALKRADLVVLTHVNTARENIQNVLAVVEKWAHRATVIHTVHEAVGISGFPKRGEQRGFDDIRDRVCLISAIGSPANLRRTVEGLGGEVAAELTFMDHHVYTPEDIEKVVQGCRHLNINKVVTTHKDAVKLASFSGQLSGLMVMVLDIELRILHGENEFISSIDRVLSS
jgi:tetraacyldisaccharide 4'-kinase